MLLQSTRVITLIEEDFTETYFTVDLDFKNIQCCVTLESKGE